MAKPTGGFTTIDIDGLDRIMGAARRWAATEIGKLGPGERSMAEGSRNLVQQEVGQLLEEHGPSPVDSFALGYFIGGMMRSHNPEQGELLLSVCFTVLGADIPPGGH